MKRLQTILYCLFLFTAPCFAGVPVDLPGPPKIHLVLDRVYEAFLIGPQKGKPDPGLRVYMFNPQDGQSSATFAWGEGGHPNTEQSIAEMYEGAKVSKKPGTIAGTSVTWWSWKDSHHLYRNCDTHLKSAEGTTYKVSIFLVANSIQRIDALEASFSELSLRD